MTSTGPLLLGSCVCVRSDIVKQKPCQTQTQVGHSTETGNANKMGRRLGHLENETAESTVVED